MAITVNATGTAVENNSNTTLTIAAGTDTALVILAIGSGASVGTPTCTWAGVDCPLIGSGRNTTSSRTYALFGKVAPATGNQTSTVTAATWGDIVTCGIAFDGVDQTGGTTTFANHNSATGNSTTPSVTITTANGNYSISVMSSPVGSWTPNNTEIFFLSGSGSVDGGGQRAADSGSSTVHSATISSAQWIIGGFALLAAGGAAETITMDKWWRQIVERPRRKVRVVPY